MGKAAAAFAGRRQLISRLSPCLFVSAANHFARFQLPSPCLLRVDTTSVLSSALKTATITSAKCSRAHEAAAGARIFMSMSSRNRVLVTSHDPSLFSGPVDK